MPRKVTKVVDRTPMKKICERCGKEFTTQRYFQQIYCGTECSYNYQLEKSELNRRKLGKRKKNRELKETYKRCDRMAGGCGYRHDLMGVECAMPLYSYNRYKY